MNKEQVKKEVVKLFTPYLDQYAIAQLSEKYGYFEAPAGNYHDAYEGGLANHSLKVYKLMMKLNDSLNLGLNHQDIVITALFHDLCKVSYYKPNILKSGKRSEAKPWKFSPSIMMPHGTDSLYLLMDLGVSVNVSQATAIVFHSGAFDEHFRNSVNKLAEQSYDFILTWCLHSADMLASYMYVNQEDEVD